MKEAVKYTFTVRHPEYGEWRGVALDSGDALVLAAAHWGVRWTGIAGECVITKLGKAVALHCRRCNGPVYQDGALCADCCQRRIDFVKKRR